jgi:hypothetical protein
LDRSAARTGITAEDKKGLIEALESRKNRDVRRITETLFISF